MTATAAVLLAAWGVSAQDPPAQQTPPATDAPATDAPATDAPATQTPEAAKPAEDDSKYDPPLTDAAKVREWEKTQSGRLRFKQALKLDRLSNADREELTRATQMYLYRMTLRENRTSVYDVVREFLDDVNSPQLTTNEARDYVNSEVVRIGPELLGQPPNVRVNLMILAASLLSDPKTEPPRPYAGATPLFLMVLDDPDQFVDSKIWAAKGLGRICRDGDVPISERSNIATHLVAALDSSAALDPKNWWYRMRLVDALGDTGLLYNLSRQPIIVDALMSVLANPKERWLVRSAAARAVTHIPWESADNINVPLVCYHVTRLVREMAEARNANLKSPQWGYSFVYAYVSFRPQTQAERQRQLGLLHQVTRSGLSQHEPVVQAAFQAVLPVVNSVLRNPQQPGPTGKEDLQRLDEWLQNNRPQDWKPTPASRQLPQTETRTTRMATTRAPANQAAERSSGATRPVQDVAVPAAAFPAAP